MISTVAPAVASTATPSPAVALPSPELSRLRREVLHKACHGLDECKIVTPAGEDRADIIRRVNVAIEDITPALAVTDREMLFREVLNEFFGFGPIQPLLDDPAITEVMVNRADRVYVEKNGKPQLTPIVFDNDAHVRRIIDRIILPLGRRLDSKNPLVDARLPDGSRVNAVIPPCSIDGPGLTIRKFSKTPLTVEDLIRFGTLTAPIGEFFKACVRARLNIIVSGGTGSGKTTLLNVLSSFIPTDERIVTIEDAAELKLGSLIPTAAGR
jgi:pilus assembly protein CpaF